MKVRGIIVLMTVILLMVFIQGCGGKQSAADLTFMYWSDSPQAADAYTGWLNEYQQLTQKSLNEQYAPFGEGYNQKLLILIGAKQAPDLFLLPPDYLQTFKEKGALRPLDDLLAADGLPRPEPEDCPGVYGTDGKIYAIPVNEHTTLVIFSRTEKADTAWNLLKFISKKLLGD